MFLEYYFHLYRLSLTLYIRQTLYRPSLKISQLQAIQITEQALKKEIPDLKEAHLYFYLYNFSSSKYQASDPEYERYIRQITSKGGWSYSHVEAHPELLQLPLLFVQANGTQYQIGDGIYAKACLKAPDVSHCPLPLPAADAAKNRLVYRVESVWNPPANVTSVSSKSGFVLHIPEGYHIVDAETGKVLWDSISWQRSLALIPKVNLYNNETNPEKTIKQLEQEKQLSIEKALNPPLNTTVEIVYGASDNTQTKNFIPNDARAVGLLSNRIIWKNEDTVAHTVTSDNGYSNQYTGKFDSGIIESGQSYQYTFIDVGSYAYHCEIHPYMTGKVEVVQNFS